MSGAKPHAAARSAERDALLITDGSGNNPVVVKIVDNAKMIETSRRKAYGLKEIKKELWGGSQGRDDETSPSHSVDWRERFRDEDAASTSLFDRGI